MVYCMFKKFCFMCLTAIATLQKDFYTFGQRNTEDTTGSYGPPRLVCYYLSWVRYYDSPMSYFPENIPQQLCDEIEYYHSNLNEDTFDIDYEDDDADIVNNGMKEFVAMKTNVSVVMIAIGGYQRSLKGFSKLANRQNRKNFTKNVLSFMKRHDFNGFLIDWTYPGSNETDQSTYVQIVKDLSKEFQKRNFVLAITGPNSKEILRAGYNVRELAKYADEIHVKSYEMWGSWNDVAYPHNPLYKDTLNTKEQNNIKHLMEHWVNEGASRRQLFVGITLYGTTLHLSPEADGLLGSPINGTGEQHKYSKSPGHVTYYEVCSKVMSGEWKEEWDNDGIVPFAFDLKQNQWASYENPKSAYQKAKFTKDEGYGGIFVYGASYDDFRGLCGPKYAITNAIKTGLTN